MLVTRKTKPGFQVWNFQLYPPLTSSEVGERIEIKVMIDPMVMKPQKYGVSKSFLFGEHTHILGG